MLPGASIGARLRRRRTHPRRLQRRLPAARTRCTINATVSAGIAQATPVSTLDALLKAADIALYQAKRHGRDRVEVADRGERQPADGLVERPPRRFSPSRWPDSVSRPPSRRAISALASSESHAAGPSTHADPAAVAVDEQRRRQAEGEPALLQRR